MREFHPGRQHLGFPVRLRTHGNCHMLLWRVSVLKKRWQIKGKEGHRGGMVPNIALQHLWSFARSQVLLSGPLHAEPFCHPDVKIPAGDHPSMPNLDFLQAVVNSVSYPRCFSFDWYSREWPLADQGDKYFFNHLGGLQPQCFNMSSLVWNASSFLCEACWAILKPFITPVKMIKNTNKKPHDSM